MRRLTKGLLLGVIALLLLSLTACNKAELEKVKVGEVTRSIFYAPQYVALEKDSSRRRVFLLSYKRLQVAIKR